MLDGWNRAVTPMPEATTVSSLVEAQAARSPDAVAIVAGSTRITYAQLDGSATRLAGHLRGRGVGPGTFVGVCAERSPALVTALLAVLKTGAAYLPLDPGYPAERLGFMLADARPHLVLSSPRLRARCRSRHREHRARRPPAWAGGGTVGGHEAGAGPDARAYATYTSGSTAGRRASSLATHGAGQLSRLSDSRVLAGPRRRHPAHRHRRLRRLGARDLWRAGGGCALGAAR